MPAWQPRGPPEKSTKFVLIVIWFGFPQQQQYPDHSSVAWRQPLGVAMQEFDDKDACEAQAKYFASPVHRRQVRTEELGSVPQPALIHPTRIPTECRPFADDFAPRGRYRGRMIPWRPHPCIAS
jgi:hypothetical protein